LPFGFAFLILGLLFAVPGLAQAAKPEKNDLLSSLAFRHDKLRAAEEVEVLDDVRQITGKSLQDGWEAFRLGVGRDAEWQASVDRRTALISFADGGNVPWIPGHGNRMTIQDLAGILKAKPRVDLEVLDAIARSFLPRVSGLLGVDPAQLALNRGRSGQRGGYLWFVDYDVVRDGLPIEGARVLFRVNNGNLIQFGSENLPSPGAAVPPTRLTKQQARAAVSRYIGGFQESDTFWDDGSLHLVPIGIPSAKASGSYETGRGRGLVKVWQLAFHREGATETWRAWVDASTGEMLELIDTNQYAQVKGGVYLGPPATTPETVRPMPYADLSTGGFANSAGVYPYASGSVSSTLNGQYVKIEDLYCLPGSISKSTDSSGSGNILFGTSTGTDCVTPSTGGGAGNTHAARNAYYQVNRAKDMARGWMPTNTFINQQQLVSVNTNNVCGPYVGAGYSLNFQQSYASTVIRPCTNSGENPGMVIHEFGHALDDNDGTLINEVDSTQSYGDTLAMIALHDSCIGRGFWYINCSGYGDACSSCMGLREADYAQHASNLPATAAGFIATHCPNPFAGDGPSACGKLYDCESYVPTETMWDVANRDLPAPGTAAAWATLDRLWFLSRSTATQAFSCSPSTGYTSDGCGAGSLWKVFRAADDDDGNLSNGTPHGGALYAAFTRHQISCTKEPGAGATFAGCTPPAKPTLTATPGDDLVSLSWTGTHGAVYDVFRNENGCNTGFARIASGATTALFTDNAVADGTTYYYQVTAYPAGNEACASAPSTCVAVTPVAAPCVPTAAPASLTATAPASGGVALSWPAVTGASAYAIYRATVSGGPYPQVGSAFGTTFTDVSAASGIANYYVVRAVHAANDGTTCNSVNSPQASAVPVPDFSLSISPGSVTIPPFGGNTANYTISINRTGGFTGGVTLSLTGLPPGSTNNLPPIPVTTGSFMMHVTVNTPGTWLLTVTGTSGALTPHTATATLTKRD
jgi:hypothetical protein